MIDPEVLEEFKTEADEMLNESEEFLLLMEKKENFKDSFNAVFRSFHSLKGAAEMFEINHLLSFMHTIESQFETLKGTGNISQAQIDYFLQAADAARTLITTEGHNFDTAVFDKLDTKAQGEVIQDAPSILQQKKKASKRVQKKSEKKKGLVYVVDDEKFIGNELGEILTEFGFETKVFINPVDCFEAIVEEEPDLLCTDLKMPQMSGMELLEKIRAKKLKCPVVFITGFIDNKLLTEGLGLGASGFLEKPFEEHEVVSLASQSVERNRIRKLLNRSLSYILYQYNDLDNYLKDEGKEIVRQNLKAELETLLTLKKELN